MALPIERKSDPERDEWYTPEWLFQAMGVQFDLDPCHPGTDLARVPALSKYTREHDGLARDWSGFTFVNAPYSEVGAWGKKFVVHGDGLFLCFARTETAWFQDVARKCDGMFLLNKRMRFIPGAGQTDGWAAAPSVLLACGRRGMDVLRHMERTNHGLLYTREVAW